jgi:hypothetical protein
MIRARVFFGVLAGVLVAIGVGAAACSGVQEQSIGVDAPSGSEEQFGPVADYLEHRCGSLDCHGQVGRNLRVWGCQGMRLDPNDIPSCNRLIGGNLTTPAEHQATYRSLVGLEPAVMSAVVQGQGQDPELLTFVRKACGIEPHAGGQLITLGDDQYGCITSWLAGNTDATLCVDALTFPAFPDGSAPVTLPDSSNP